MFDANRREVMQAMWITDKPEGSARPIIDWIIAWTNAIAYEQERSRGQKK